MRYSNSTPHCAHRPNIQPRHSHIDAPATPQPHQRQTRDAILKDLHCLLAEHRLRCWPNTDRDSHFSLQAMPRLEPTSHTDPPSSTALHTNTKHAEDRPSSRLPPSSAAIPDAEEQLRFSSPRLFRRASAQVPTNRTPNIKPENEKRHEPQKLLQSAIASRVAVRMGPGLSDFFWFSVQFSVQDKM